MIKFDKYLKILLKIYFNCNVILEIHGNNDTENYLKES